MTKVTLFDEQMLLFDKLILFVNNDFFLKWPYKAPPELYSSRIASFALAVISLFLIMLDIC